MTELKPVGDEEIKTAYKKVENITINSRNLVVSPMAKAGAQAQLEADKKVMEQRELMIEGYMEQAKQAIVQEIFEEIEERLFTHDGDGNLILTSAPPRDRVVIWWQALKRKYVKKVKDD